MVWENNPCWRNKKRFLSSFFMRATWDYEKCIIQSHAPARDPRETVCQYLRSFQSHRVDQGYPVNQWPCSSKCPSVSTTGRVIPPLHILLCMGRCCFKCQEASVSWIINTLASFEKKKIFFFLWRWATGAFWRRWGLSRPNALLLLYTDQRPHGSKRGCHHCTPVMAADLNHFWSKKFDLKRAGYELHFV